MRLAIRLSLAVRAPRDTRLTGSGVCRTRNRTYNELRVQAAMGVTSSPDVSAKHAEAHRVDDQELCDAGARQRGAGAVQRVRVHDGHEVGVLGGADVLGRQARELERVDLAGRTHHAISKVPGDGCTGLRAQQTEHLPCKLRTDITPAQLCCCCRRCSSAEGMRWLCTTSCSSPQQPCPMLYICRNRGC